MSRQLRDAIAKATVAVVGDVMLDRYWSGDVSRISPEAPVPVLLVEQTEDRLGGAANVARNVASVGATAHMFGVVGADEPGRLVRQLLAKGRIVDRVIDDATTTTTIKLRAVARRQQLLRIDFELAPNHEVLRANLDDVLGALSHVEALVLSDYGKGGLTHIRRLIGAARDAGRPVIVDPKGRDYSQYAGATLITPNRAELAQVVGSWDSEADLTRRAQTLREALQIDQLLLTRSEEGMTLFGSGGAQHYPAQAREVFDVSGAGDTVVGTLAVALAAGASLHEAVSLANKAGGIVVGKFGTATVTADELFA